MCSLSGETRTLSVSARLQLFERDCGHGWMDIYKKYPTLCGHLEYTPLGGGHTQTHAHALFLTNTHTHRHTHTHTYTHTQPHIFLVRPAPSSISSLPNRAATPALCWSKQCPGSFCHGIQVNKRPYHDRPLCLANGGLCPELKVTTLSFPHE